MFRIFLEFQHFTPAPTFNSICEFLTDFFIRYKSSLHFLIVPKVSQMNHIGQHIILALDVYCVIFKGCRVHPDFCTGDHLNDSVFQSIVIHVDQRHNCIIRSSFRPIAFEFPSEHHTDNCPWVIDLIFIQQISVIPTLYFIEILMIFFCQFLHFLLSKTDIRCKVASTQHGKLIKIVQC